MTLSHEQLTSSMRNILKTADLDTLSAKQVRKQLESEFKCEMTEHKKFIDKKLMQLLDELPAEKENGSESSSAAESEEESEPEKKVAPKRKAEPKAPVAKKKAVPKVVKPAAAKNEIYTDSDSDAEFSEPAPSGPPQPSKRAAKKAPGAGRGEVADCRLSPELAAIVGAEILSRSEVTRRIHQECILRKLHESDDRTYIICDEQFKKLFGGQERLRVSTLTNHCKKHITKLSKAELNGGKKKRNVTTGYMKAAWLDPVLADVLGHNRMARSQVIKELWKIIKERGLQDPRNKQFMLVDDQLMAVFKKKRVKTFGMMSYVSKLISNEEFWSYDREYPEYISDKAKIEEELKTEAEEQDLVKKEEPHADEETNGVNETNTGS